MASVSKANLKNEDYPKTTSLLHTEQIECEFHKSGERATRYFSNFGRRHYTNGSWVHTLCRRRKVNILSNDFRCKGTGGDRRKFDLNDRTGTGCLKINTKKLT